MKNIEFGTLKHAFRNEMSEIVHWALVWAFAIVVGMQITQAWASDVAAVNQIYTYFL